MTEKTPREIHAALAQPFAPEDLEWRIQRAFEEKMCGLAVPYVTNRAIMNRLDDVVGMENWYNEYRPWHSTGKKDAQICGISIYFENRGWVTKWDGAEDTDVEPVKGGLSDSMKRAAVHWGIGRVLYNMDAIWVDVEKRGRSFSIPDKERPKLNRAYLNLLDGLHILPAPAGGTQAQLVSKVTPEAAAEEGLPPARETQPPAPTQTPPPAPPPVPAPAEKTTPFPAPPEPAWEYTVQTAKVQKGMNDISTKVMLESRDGRRVNAFARGARDDLSFGTRLKNVKLAQRQQDMVVFHILERYEIVQPGHQAA